MTATWDSLPRRTRIEVHRHVTEQAATFGSVGIEDVIRWSVDGLLLSGWHSDYDEGYEDGLQAEARAS